MNMKTIINTNFMASDVSLATTCFGPSWWPSSGHEGPKHVVVASLMIPRSNGRTEMRKLCTINNSAESSSVDINIIPD
jgi:hypothetical protein